MSILVEDLGRYDALGAQVTLELALGRLVHRHVEVEVWDLARSQHLQHPHLVLLHLQQATGCAEPAADSAEPAASSRLCFTSSKQWVLLHLQKATDSASQAVSNRSDSPAVSNGSDNF